MNNIVDNNQNELAKNVSITINTLLDNPKLEFWLSGNSVFSTQSLPYNIFAINILFEYSMKQQAQLIIIGDETQAQYFPRIKEDLASMNYRDIVFVSANNIKQTVQNSHYHICSSIKEFLLVQGDCALIADMINGCIMQIMDLFRSSNISEYRTHFFGLWNLITYTPVLSHMIVFLPLTFEHSVRIVHALRSLYIQLTFLIAILDVVQTLTLINSERGFFYDKQCILYGEEYITSYCSKELSLILVGVLSICLLINIYIGFVSWNIVAISVSGLLIWFTYKLPTITKMFLRTSGLLLVSYVLQQLV